MNKIWLNVLSTVMAAAIIGNVTMLWKFSERLTRIETKLDLKP